MLKSVALAAVLAAFSAPAFAQASNPHAGHTMPSTAATPASPATPAAPASGTAATPATPAQSPAMAAMMTACQKDFATQCPGKTGPDMRTCVQENFAKMSETCQGALMTMMQSQGAG